MNVRVLCQDRTCKRFKILVRSNSQVQYFSFICIASVRFTKKHFIASLSRVDLFFKDEVEGMNRAPIIPITEGGIIPDNFLPTTLLEILETWKHSNRGGECISGELIEEAEIRINSRRGLFADKIKS